MTQSCPTNKPPMKLLSEHFMLPTHACKRPAQRAKPRARRAQLAPMGDVDGKPHTHTHTRPQHEEQTGDQKIGGRGGQGKQGHHPHRMAEPWSESRASTITRRSGSELAGCIFDPQRVRMSQNVESIKKRSTNVKNKVAFGQLGAFGASNFRHAQATAKQTARTQQAAQCSATRHGGA